MLRSAAWMLSLALSVVPLAATAGEQTPTGAAEMTVEDMVRDYVAGISEAFDQNPHSCYEPDQEEERPDLAIRPQS